MHAAHRTGCCTNSIPIGRGNFSWYIGLVPTQHYGEFEENYCFVVVIPV